MQNPPTIPTAPVCWLTARLKGALFIIDWHNYMYSVLRDKYSKVFDVTRFIVFSGLYSLTFEQQRGISETQEIIKEKESSRKRREEKPVVGLNKKRKEKPEQREYKSFRQRCITYNFNIPRNIDMWKLFTHWKGSLEGKQMEDYALQKLCRRTCLITGAYLQQLFMIGLPLGNSGNQSILLYKCF